MDRYRRTHRRHGRSHALLVRGPLYRQFFLDGGGLHRLFLNLFNLIPISPLDGGRTVAAISPKLWIVGFIGILFMFFRSFNPILLIILFPAGRNVYELWKNRNERMDEYYEVDRKTRLQISLIYFGLLVFLAVAMSLTHVKR